jgi:hypothetical protein
VIKAGVVVYNKLHGNYGRVVSVLDDHAFVSLPKRHKAVQMARLKDLRLLNKRERGAQ